MGGNRSLKASEDRNTIGRREVRFWDTCQGRFEHQQVEINVRWRERGERERKVLFFSGFPGHRDAEAWGHLGELRK